MTYPSRSKICKLSNMLTGLISLISLYDKYTSVKLIIDEIPSSSNNPHLDIHNICTVRKDEPKSLK